MVHCLCVRDLGLEFCCVHNTDIYTHTHTHMHTQSHMHTCTYNAHTYNHTHTYNTHTHTHNAHTHTNTHPQCFLLSSPLITPLLVTCWGPFPASQWVWSALSSQATVSCQYGTKRCVRGGVCWGGVCWEGVCWGGMCGKVYCYTGNQEIDLSWEVYTTTNFVLVCGGLAYEVGKLF